MTGRAGGTPVGTEDAWKFGSFTGALTVLTGWLPGLILGATFEVNSSAYKAAHTAGQAIGYWSFPPWREGFIAGWVLTLIFWGFICGWVTFRGKSWPRSTSVAGAAGGFVFGSLGAVFTALFAMIVPIAIALAAPWIIILIIE